jgi:hypothetical protein
MSKAIYEDATPNPEFLIKSIAEQGYSLETSLADLMDNSISAGANKIEVLVDFESEPINLFLADNGLGMTEDELIKNMKFPSNSPDSLRKNSDLGRFGLGLKTASFSQTRKFTVLSKKLNDKKYNGRTWDVNHLKNNGWEIIVNSEKEVADLIYKYQNLSNSLLNKHEDYSPNTIIVWEGLYKFENYLSEENKLSALKKEITEVTTNYLSLVFHRFLENDNNPLNIRINNSIIKPFNPFPVLEKDFRQIEPRQSKFSNDVINIEGFVLPARAISESSKGLSIWTTPNLGLMDMEGIYIYRADRIILFGGWNGIVKKAPRLQLARLKVEVGNSVDHLLHLNVAKSQIIIPHELRNAFEDYIEDLKAEAEREFYNRGIRKFSGTKANKKIQLFERSFSNKGSILQVNSEFPVVKNLKDSLSSSQRSQLNLLLRMINNRVNDIRHVFEEKDFVGVEENDGLSIDDLEVTIKGLIEGGIELKFIREDVIPHLGYKYSTLPSSIKTIFE